MKLLKHASRYRARVGLALGGLLLLGPSVEAQRWGRPSFPRTGACFYRDVNFRGDYFCARAGEEFSRIPDGLNNEISSIRTFGDAEVEVYQSSRFNGRRQAFRGDVRDLRREGWNDRLSSLRVTRGGSRYDDDDRRGRRNDRYDDDRRGGRHGNHMSRTEAERIVRRAYRDILDRDPDGPGLRLYANRMVDDDWSESQVREALRTSPEYRQKNAMTRQKAEEIVARAYRSVLGREPDRGAQTYVDKVYRNNWSQSDVERELRKSPEYRNRRH